LLWLLIPTNYWKVTKWPSAGLVILPPSGKILLVSYAVTDSLQYWRHSSVMIADMCGVYA